jgi:hypothetical protein
MSYLDQFKFDKVHVMRLRARNLSTVWKNRHMETINNLESQLKTNLLAYENLRQELDTVVKQRDRYAAMVEVNLGLLPKDSA